MLHSHLHNQINSRIDYSAGKRFALNAEWPTPAAGPRPRQMSATRKISRPIPGQLSFDFRGGFILFRTGFFGGGTKVTVPPLASIFVLAAAEAKLTVKFSFFVTSPSARMRTPASGRVACPRLCVGMTENGSRCPRKAVGIAPGGFCGPAAS